MNPRLKLLAISMLALAGLASAQEDIKDKALITGSGIDRANDWFVVGDASTTGTNPVLRRMKFSELVNVSGMYSTLEPALGNPEQNGYVLSSTTSGTRSWIAMTSDLTSGPVRSSSGVSTIADGALSIAKTSGLQTALDGKQAIPVIPSAIANLEVWFSAGSLALSNGASVSSWTDSSGNGHTAAQGTAGNRPTYVTDAFRGMPAVRFDGTNDYLETDAIYGGTETEITAFIVHAKPTDGLGMSLAITGTPALTDSSRFWLGANSNQQVYCSNYVGHAGAVGSTRLPRILAMTSNTAKVRRLFVDGYVGMRDTASQNLGLSGVMRLGASVGGSYPSDADIYEVIIYKRALTDTEINAVHAYLQAKYWPSRSQVFFIGDSFVTGLGATVPANVLVNNLGTRMGTASLVTGWGTSGISVASIASTNFAYAKPFLTAPQAADPVAVIVAGRNDLTAGTSAATILTSVKALCASFRSAGYKVVYVTPTPYQTGAMETARQTLIDSILADTTFADAIANAGRDPIMGDIANVANTTYFNDGLHPTNTGYTIMTRIIEAAVHACQGRSSGSSNPVARSKVVSLDFGSTLSAATASTTVSVIGASLSAAPAVIVSGALPTGWDLVGSYVSADDTVTIVARNNSGSTSDPAAVTVRIMTLGEY